MAVGAASETLKIAFVGTVLVLVATLLGAAADLVILSQLLGVAAALSAVLWLRLAKRRLEFSAAALWRCWFKSLVLAVATAAVPLEVVTEMGWRSPQIILSTSIAAVGGALGFLLAAWLTRHQVWIEVCKFIRR